MATKEKSVEQRLSAIKAMAEMILKEAVIIEKELGLVEGPAPRKGSAKAVRMIVRQKYEQRLLNRIAKGPKPKMQKP